MFSLLKFFIVNYFCYLKNPPSLNTNLEALSHADGQHRESLAITEKISGQGIEAIRPIRLISDRIVESINLRGAG